MAQSGYTPIVLFHSTTTGNVPTTSNLAVGELAINNTDGKLFYNTGSAIAVLAGAGGAGIAGGSNTQVQYNSSGSLAGSANMTFSGTTLTLANDASISGLTVGKGGGSVAANTAVGSSALTSTTTGNWNTAVGYQASYLNTTGENNVAVGRLSMYSNTTGVTNTAVGVNALYSNTTASNNTASGTNALYANTTGASNTAVGSSALTSNTTASNNTAVGYQAGYTNTVGTLNTYIGNQAAYTATGSYNTVIGSQAGKNLTTGTDNTFVGPGNYAAGYYVTSGSKNTILGGFTGNQGGLDIRTASNYIVLSDGDGNPRGFNTVNGVWKFSNCNTQNSYSDSTNEFYSNSSNRTLLCFNSSTGYTTENILSYVATNSGTGYTFFTGQNSQGVQVKILGNGNLQNANNSYGAFSDVKLKENIIDATPKLEDLCKVKVRQYNLKSDPSHKQIGVVAQELEEVFAGLVEETKDLDEKGQDLGTTTKAVKYSVFVPMLIKAIQELKAEVDSLKQQLGK